jgi:hypothetical protein
MSSWIEALSTKHQRGSLPRCLSFAEGGRKDVATRIADLVSIEQFQITDVDVWMPHGVPILGDNKQWDCSRTQEARLGISKEFLSAEQRQTLRQWWLAVPDGANVPNWDLAATCHFAGVPALLLVEAKAHASELHTDPKSVAESEGSINNHTRIGEAIAEASVGLNQAAPGWNISRDSHYQLANRFAWSWKLATMGIPVILVYLGFLEANEMDYRGEPFVDPADWARVVLEHSRDIVPSTAWGRTLKVGSASITPLIRSFHQPLPS